MLLFRPIMVLNVDVVTQVLESVGVEIKIQNFVEPEKLANDVDDV